MSSVVQILAALLFFAGFAAGGSVIQRCDSSDLSGCHSSSRSLENSQETTDNEESISNVSNVSSSSSEARNDKLIDDWFGEIYATYRKDNDGDRTWRINRKALVPILIGLAIKALAMIAIALSGLMIVGTIAIFTSKVSLIISIMMSLRRFFSSDHSNGGFFGLNPLNYPHASTRAPDHQYQNAGHRKSMFMHRPYGRSLDNDIQDYARKFKEP